MATRTFYRTANAIGPTWKRSGTRRCNFGAYPCLPALLYGLEACPLRRSDITSLDFVVNRFYMKLFQTNKIDIVNYCRAQFEFDLYTYSTVVDKRSKNFVAKYRLCENVVCKFA